MRISDWRSDVCSSDLPQKVIWAYGQRGVKRHSMWTDMGGAQRLPSITSTERPFGRRTGWAIFWVMPASAPAIRTWLDRPCVWRRPAARKSVGAGKRVSVRLDLGGRRDIKKKHNTK